MANDKIICKCYKVTEKDIKKAIKKGAESAKDIRKETKADTACRHCTKKFEKTVKEEVGITVTFKAIDLEVSILED